MRDICELVWGPLIGVFRSRAAASRRLPSLLAMEVEIRGGRPSTPPEIRQLIRDMSSRKPKFWSFWQQLNVLRRWSAGNPRTSGRRAAVPAMVHRSFDGARRQAAEKLHRLHAPFLDHDQ